MSHCPITQCTTTYSYFQSPPSFKTVSHCPITFWPSTFSFFQSPSSFKTVSHSPLTLCTTMSRSFNLHRLQNRVPLSHSSMHNYVQIPQSPPLFKTESHCPIPLCTTSSRSDNLLPSSKPCPIVSLLYRARLISQPQFLKFH
jgi:hypothetical protein